MRKGIKRLMALAMPIAMLMLMAMTVVAGAKTEEIGDFDLIATPFGMSYGQLHKMLGDPIETEIYEDSGYSFARYVYEKSDGRIVEYYFADGALAYVYEEWTFYRTSNAAYKDFQEQAKEMLIWYGETIEEGIWEGEYYIPKTVLRKSDRFSLQWDLHSGKAELGAYWEEGERCVMVLVVLKTDRGGDKKFCLIRIYSEPEFFYDYSNS